MFGDFKKKSKKKTNKPSSDLNLERERTAKWDDGRPREKHPQVIYRTNADSADIEDAAADAA